MPQRQWALPGKVGRRAPFERSKNVVQVAANRDKLRKVGEQKGEKRFAGFCYKLSLFSGLRRLRQDLAKLVSRFASRGPRSSPATSTNHFGVEAGVRSNRIPSWVANSESSLKKPSAFADCGNSDGDQTNVVPRGNWPNFVFRASRE